MQEEHKHDLGGVRQGTNALLISFLPKNRFFASELLKVK